MPVPKTPKTCDTVQEVLFWSYANLAMAHSAVSAGQSRYKTLNYMIRAKLYKGLLGGTMSVAGLMEDERIKLLSGTRCSYCGVTGPQTLDHIFPRVEGGGDSADNLIFACRSCNSSKGPRDLLDWFAAQGRFPPLAILRRYLKLSIGIARDRNLMTLAVAQAGAAMAPVRLAAIPLSYPRPDVLCWTAGGEGGG